MRHVSSVPLNPEWVELAKKQMKGADPEGTLSWKTMEVCTKIVKMCILCTGHYTPVLVTTQ